MVFTVAGHRANCAVVVASTTRVGTLPIYCYYYYYIILCVYETSAKRQRDEPIGEAVPARDGIRTIIYHIHICVLQYPTYVVPTYVL